MKQTERVQDAEARRRVGRPMAYRTPAAFRKAVNAYFDSISRTVPLRIWQPTGQVTSKGRPDMELVTVTGADGAPILHTEYIQEPSVAGLCLALGISEDTWENYLRGRYPGYREIAETARLIIKARLVDLSLTKEKGLQGILFNLSANFGMAERRELELGRETRQAISMDNMTMDEKLALIREAAAAAADVEIEDDEDGGEQDE